MTTAHDKLRDVSREWPQYALYQALLSEWDTRTSERDAWEAECEAARAALDPNTGELTRNAAKRVKAERDEWMKEARLAHEQEQLRRSEVAEIIRAITDPENQPSQWGTVLEKDARADHTIAEAARQWYHDRMKPKADDNALDWALAEVLRINTLKEKA